MTSVTHENEQLVFKLDPLSPHDSLTGLQDRKLGVMQILLPTPSFLQRP